MILNCSDVGDSGSGTPPSTASSYAWYVVGILALITFLSQFDRYLTALLVRPLRAEFGISDTQFSLLHGYAFVLTFVIFGLPLGRLVDRTNRRNLILAGLLAWSLMTAAAAFSRNFTELVIARMGVGIGEAVLAPAAYSIIADYFGTAQRGRATGFYYTSIAFGAGFALVLGGMLLRVLSPNGLVILGVVALKPWQGLFLLAGLPGFVAALLLLTVREPARREREVEHPVPMRVFFEHIVARRQAFFRAFGANALATVVGYGILAWAPALFDRRFAITPTRSGLFIGAAMILTGLTGPQITGWLSDRWISRQVPAARFRIIYWAICLVLPASTWALMPNPYLCYAMLVAALFGLTIVQAAMPVAMQEVVPNEMRGQVVTLYLLISNLVGIGLGPTSVALLTDRVFKGDDMLGWSLASTALPAALLSLWVSRSALSPYEMLYSNRHAAASSSAAR